MLAASVNDAERGGIEPASFNGSRVEADAPEDHGVAVRAFGIIVVGGRHIRIANEGDHRVPVIEDFAG